MNFTAKLNLIFLKKTCSFLAYVAPFVNIDSIIILQQKFEIKATK